MLRRGAAIGVQPLGDGMAGVVLSFGETAEALSAARAETWGAEPENPPAAGDPERDAVLPLAAFFVSDLANLPRG